MKYILRFRFLLRTSDSCFEYKSFISAGAWKIKEINKQIDSQWSTQNKMHSVTNYKTLNKNSSGTITSFQLQLKTKCNMNEPVELSDRGHTVRSESVWGLLMQINCEPWTTSVMCPFVALVIALRIRQHRDNLLPSVMWAVAISQACFSTGRVSQHTFSQNII